MAAHRIRQCPRLSQAVPSGISCISRRNSVFVPYLVLPVAAMVLWALIASAKKAAASPFPGRGSIVLHRHPSDRARGFGCGDRLPGEGRTAVVRISSPKSGSRTADPAFDGMRIVIEIVPGAVTVAGKVHRWPSVRLPCRSGAGSNGLQIASRLRGRSRPAAENQMPRRGASAHIARAARSDLTGRCTRLGIPLSGIVEHILDRGGGRARLRRFSFPHLPQFIAVEKSIGVVSQIVRRMARRIGSRAIPGGSAGKASTFS